MNRDEIDQLSKAFKALSNPNRLRLFLNLMKESEMSVDEGHESGCFLGTLIQNLNVGAPTVSHHIKELVNANLIKTERRGKQLVCTIDTATLQRVKHLFD